MLCSLCQNELSTEVGQSHLCVKDNSSLFGQRRSEASMVLPSEFPEYLDELDFFDAAQVVDGGEL